MKTYVGITGIKSITKVKELNKHFSDYHIRFSHMPMYSFMVTDKRLADPANP